MSNVSVPGMMPPNLTPPSKPSPAPLQAIPSTSLLPPKPVGFANTLNPSPLQQQEKPSGNINGTNDLTQQLPISERLAVWRDERLAGLRSWREFVDRQMFVLPSDATVLRVRLRRNLIHYQSNYLVITLALLAYCLLTNPSLLLASIVITVAFVGLGRLPEGELLSFAEFRLQRQHLFICWAICAALVTLVFLDIVLFWVIGASAIIAVAHAAVHDVFNCSVL